MNTNDWNMGRLMDLATGYWKSAVLSAGVELGCFDRLSDGPATLEQLLDEDTPSGRRLAEVLDALAALGLLEKSGDQYQLAPGAEALLNRHQPTCILDALRFNLDLYPLWGRLAESVRTGKPALPPGAHLGDDKARTRRFALGMHSRAMGMAPALLPALDAAGVGTLLDIAAGPGTFSRLLAERYPDLKITQFELPGPQAVARELTQAHPASDRISFVAGDYHRDELPEGFDAALLCGAIHQEDEAFARTLFARVHRALHAGGVFWVVDLMLDEDRAGPLFSNLFSINMMLTSPNGRVFTADTLLALLEASGFASVSLEQPAHSPYWIVKGVKA